MQLASSPSKKFVTTAQLADYLHYSEDRVRTLAREGKIPGAFKRQESWLFDLDIVVKEFLSSSDPAHAGRQRQRPEEVQENLENTPEDDQDDGQSAEEFIEG